MNKRQFVQNRSDSWRQFDRLASRLNSVGFKTFSSRDVNEFSRLFREMTNDLATVRSREWGAELETYLNHLVSRGHSAFYTAPPGGIRDVLTFLAIGFPKLLRENIWYFVTASLLFFGTGAISWAVVQNNPELARRVIPDAQLEGVEMMYGKSAGERAGHNVASTKEQQATMAGHYVENNVGIALMCYARGVLLGIGTVYTLLFNGIYIGAIGGYVMAVGDRELFLSFVITHGSFELTAIAVSGAGGLMLGNAILHPGSKTRLQSIRERGLDSVKIAFGAAVMLVVAAAIEGFWSQSAVSVSVKYFVGTLLWIVVILYFTLAGRGT